MDLSTHVTRGDVEGAAERLAGLRDAPTAERKDALRRLRAATDDDPAPAAPLVDDLAPFLTDDDRSVRLSTAKVFAAVAEAEPGRVLSARDDLADRLADEGEFYYVRARCAEALGYAAVERPEEVASPELLADLRVGLAFDEPGVRTKLAKALEGIALGDPDRLRHQVSALAEHLDDDEELVRYHLLTALTVLACEHPERVAEVREEVADRLGDEDPVVRGRAAETLGVLAQAGTARDGDADDDSLADRLAAIEDADDAFLADRVAFALAALDGRGTDREFEAVGSVEGVRTTTADAVDAITAPDGSECPHCDTVVPPDAPTCPVCGAPRRP
ncbi:sister chromatid cohesion protein PDS5 [Halobaculum sp. EA56]|uniref:sister chromatid cohesion protein PDS5 n=1 Tax=Halobaculum sp. EA56 TaxID=3421648 RepID=UPI003EBFE40E